MEIERLKMNTLQMIAAGLLLPSSKTIWSMPSVEQTPGRTLFAIGSTSFRGVAGVIMTAILAMNASHFDGTEIKTILQMAAALLGVEAIKKGKEVWGSSSE